VPEYPNPMVERDLKFKNIIEPYHQNPDRKDFDLRLAITQTCRQTKAETRLLPYTYAKYEMNGWFVWWLMVLDDDARAAAWDTVKQAEKNSIKSLYHVMRKHYDAVGANSHLGILFDNLRGPFDSFLSESD
jgi:hypothetical protein